MITIIVIIAIVGWAIQSKNSAYEKGHAAGFIDGIASAARAAENTRLMLLEENARNAAEKIVWVDSPAITPADRINWTFILSGEEMLDKYQNQAMARVEQDDVAF